LKKDWTFDEIIPAPKKPQKLPVVLSPEEVLHFLQGIGSTKHRAILTTCYAAGLRISESVHLKPTDLDSQRMVIRVEQGKGQKDRYVMLSPKLLETLRRYWRAVRPKGWLFEGDIPGSRSAKAPSNRPVRRLGACLVLASRSALIRCATRLPSICWNPEPTSARFNCCSATAAWQPRPATSASPPTRYAPLPARSTCCLILGQSHRPGRMPKQKVTSCLR